MAKKPGLKSLVTSVKARIDAGQQNPTDNPPWVRQVALLTGVLAAISGFLVVRSTAITNNAIYESNQAILSQTEASDAWNEYQADSIKARVVETALATATDLSPESRAALTKQAADLRDRQPTAKQTANDKTADRDRHLQIGLKWLAEKDLLGYAGLAAQLGIALASVAAMVRWRTPFIVGIAAGAVCVAITVYAYAAYYGIAP
ncbi:MAG: DUF4337 family protein [Alphaproteobacteria bacterium]|nr:DUF4337 family protein [Alphaproteobacteria bacterium]